MRPVIHINRDAFHQPEIDGLVLYRCYGLDGTLMYIGQTSNLQQRISDHHHRMPWWFAVEQITVQRYQNRRILRQDELRAITKEWPHFNQVGKGLRQTLALGLGDSRRGRHLHPEPSTFNVVQEGQNTELSFNAEMVQ